MKFVIYDNILTLNKKSLYMYIYNVCYLLPYILYLLIFYKVKD
jgi:hypothetical protein